MKEGLTIHLVFYLKYQDYLQILLLLVAGLRVAKKLQKRTKDHSPFKLYLYRYDISFHDHPSPSRN